MYYLGIDWGKTKCGIAVADEENLIASVYKQVAESEICQEVSNFSQKEKIKKIIIGSHEDLLKNKRFNNFLREIKRMGMKIELENEEFSTKIAKRNMIDADSKKISQKDDVESARIILQSWLDKII